MLAHLSRGSLVSMTVRVAGLGLAFLSHMLLSRMLGAGQYGSYVIALGWAMVLVIPARLGLDNSVLRFATIYREEDRAADFRGLVLFSLATIALVSLAIAIALFAAKSSGVAPLRLIDWPMLLGVATLIPCLATLGWLSALVRTANRIFASQFYDQVLRPALLILLLMALVVEGGQQSASKAMLATSAAVAAALLGIAIHSRAAFANMPAARPSLGHRSEWLAVSWVLFLMAAVQELLNQVDIILLGILGDATQAGHFAAAWRLSSLVPFGLAALSLVSGPLIASAYHRQDRGELARIARHSARLATGFGLILGALLSLFGRPLLGLFGPGFEEAYPALLILLAGGLVNCCTGVVGYFVMLTGHQRTALACLATALGMSVITNLLLIPRMGATGAAIASALALATWNLLLIAYVRRRLGIDASVMGAAPRARVKG